MSQFNHIQKNSDDDSHVGQKVILASESLCM